MNNLGKKALFVLFVACTIIANVEIWNLATEGYTDGFHVLFSVLNFILEGGVAFYFGKKLFKRPIKSEDTENTAE